MVNYPARSGFRPGEHRQLCCDNLRVPSSRPGAVIDSETPGEGSGVVSRPGPRGGVPVVQHNLKLGAGLICQEENVIEGWRRWRRAKEGESEFMR